jgi:GntR family transcriptional regulator
MPFKSKKQAAHRNPTDLPLPVYYQVAQLIRNNIINGIWPSGSRLPSENELTRKYQVSRPTIRVAKTILTNEGFIHSIRGSGCYINKKDTWKAQIPTVDNLNDIFYLGSKMSFRIQQYGMIANTEEIKKNLKNPKDKFVFQIKGVRWFQNQPLSSVIYYLPYRFGSKVPLERLDENPFIPQFEMLAGIQVVEGTSDISLGRADIEAAENLHIKKGSPVLIVKTVYIDNDNQPIEYIISRYKEKLPYFIRTKRF